MNSLEEENGILIPEVEVTAFADNADVGSAGKRGGKTDSRVLI